MNRTKKYTSNELSAISTEEFKEWKGLILHVIKNDNTEFKGVIANLKLAGLSDPPQLVCGFIFADGTSIYFHSIKIAYLYE